MQRRLFVHIGMQKTGTSFLQGVMERNAAALAGSTLDLVPDNRRDAFELMLLVRDRYQPGRDAPSTAGALDRFRTALSAGRAPVALLSQESLAAARRGQVRRLLAACDDVEVHVVATVRDLARQVPSSWQQELKAGRDVDYDAWVDGLVRAQQEGRRSHPWIQLDPPAALARWAEHVPAERIHVVTVPPPGGAPTVLLERWCRLLGLDALGLEVPERPANTSLGRAQAEVLRRVNAGLAPATRRRQVYGDVGKRWLSARVLAAQEGRPIRLGTQHRAWCDRTAAAQVAALAAAGYDVVGDLDDLVPLDGAYDTGGDGRGGANGPAADEVAASAVAALTSIVEQRAAARTGRSSGRGAAAATTDRPLRTLLARVRRTR